MSFERLLQPSRPGDLLLGPSDARRRRIAQILPLAIATTLGLGVAGCGGGGKEGSVAPKPAPALAREGQTLFRGERPSAGADNPDAAASELWTIILAAFRGENRQAQAAAALAQIRTTYGVPGAYVEQRGQNTVVAVGGFADPGSPEARGELARLRGYTVRGERPFAGAFLAPPFSVDLGSRPEYNLLTAKKQYGDEALYTLQVGAYGRDDLARPTEADLAESRRAAEEAAAALRREGELAFYYHGPNRSMVTVGVFDLTDFDPQTPSYQSRRLMDARKRFPHNLYNGAGVRVKRPGQAARLQPSTLVAIPD